MISETARVACQRCHRRDFVHFFTPWHRHVTVRIQASVVTTLSFVTLRHGEKVWQSDHDSSTYVNRDREPIFSKMYTVGGNVLAGSNDTRSIESGRASFTGFASSVHGSLPREYAMVQEERGVTPFGALTSDHLIYNVKTGWLAEISPREIPLRHITEVKLVIKRYRFSGIFFLVIALACGTLDFVGILIAIVPLSLAVLLLWGLPSIKVKTTNEGDLLSTAGPPWTRPEAEWFVAAVDRRRHSCA